MFNIYQFLTLLQTNNNIIQILPDFIANQIAAGEVVQKPESIIKELVENSIDAKATTISVFVKGAGKQLIHIVDNGLGISYDDLPLTIKRHATSKIKTQEDLEKIKTLGFRGEALASISAVANVEIRSKQVNSDIGYTLTSIPNEEPKIEAINCEIGTQIFVRNLFYNVPARRKFLKSNLTEFRYISETMFKFALCNHNIRFVFYDDDNLIFDVKPANLFQRISDLLGVNASKSLMEVYSENGFIKIYGFIGQPHLAKLSKSGQYLFLNGRSIVSRSLSHSVFAAFEHLLDKSMQPMFILFLELDVETFDVNVHPQKNEVKFENEQAIYNAIKKAVNNALENYNLTPSINLKQQFSEVPFETNFQNIENKFLVNTQTGEVFENKNSRSNFNENGLNRNNFPSQKSAFDEIFGNNSVSQNDILNKITNSNLDYQSFSDDTKEATNFWQLHNKYIFVQTEKGLLIVDMHNAHERVLYEKAIETMNKEFATSQSLLFPTNLMLTSGELSLLKEMENDFKDLGFQFEIISNDVIINGVPLDINKGNETNALKEILEGFDEFQEIRHSSKRDNLAATFACKSAIKTGQKIEYNEMKALIENLMKCKTPYVCPHGRPVILNYTLSDFDKQFKRTS